MLTICLQVFKFGCYLSIPALMTLAVAGNPERLAAIIRSVSHADLAIDCQHPGCALCPM